MNFSNMDWFDNVENRPHPRPGLTWLTAMLYVPSVEEAIQFYEQVFGFVPIFSLPGQDGSLAFARLRYRGCNFTISREGAFEFPGVSPNTSGFLPPLSFYVYVDDVEALYKKAMEKGCSSLKAPELQFWGDLMARFQDPFGYIWEVAAKVE